MDFKTSEDSKSPRDILTEFDSQDDEVEVDAPGSGSSPAKTRRELLVYIFPNLFTTANLFCGYFSVVASIRGDWKDAALAIFVAALLDGFDGRIARLTKTQSVFGEQYDSMSDLVSFGIAPALLMHQWALVPYGRLGWIASFLYLCCAALRLARFNALKQFTEKKFFLGCPSPVAAIAVASAVLFYAEMGLRAEKSIYMLIIMFSLGTFMISNFRYRSFKDFHFQSQTPILPLLVLILIFAAVAVRPEALIFPLTCLYLVSGPLLSIRRFFLKRSGKI